MLKKDTLLCIFSDMHSGSSVSLFPNHFMQFKHGNHTPDALQKRIRKVWERSLDHAAASRKGLRLVTVHNGDAVEGLHHNSRQTLTYIRAEQVFIHNELMDEYLQKVKFDKKAGDKLFYVTGTESHTTDKEEEIGRALRAEKNNKGGYSFDRLELEINGKLVWFAHHGPNRGDYPNAGNGVRLALSKIYWECKENGDRQPDLVVWGHVHTPFYGSYVGGSHTIHGVIAPSFQAMTRFSYKVAGLATAEVGAVFIKITVDGHIIIPPVFIKGKIEQGTRVVI